MAKTRAPVGDDALEQPSNASRGLLPLLVCAVGICSCYLCYGVLQEELFTANSSNGERPVGATFLLTSQAIMNAAFAFVWTRVAAASDSETKTSSGSKLQRLHHPLLFASKSITIVSVSLCLATYARTHHILITPISLQNAPEKYTASVCFVVAMICSNESLRFVSYPTAVLMKSSKLIPIMVLGYVVEKRRYSFLEWMSAISISAGVVLFHLSRIEPNRGDEEKQRASSSWYGMGLLSLSLFMDGLLGACQGLLKSSSLSQSRYRPPTVMETMCYVNVYAVLLLIPTCLYLNQWSHGIAQIQSSQRLFHGMLGMNLCVSIGQVFVFTTITWYSSLTCTTITTTRKFFTILLSVMHFGHQFSLTQWCSVALVFGGLYLSLVSKQKDAGKSKAKVE